MAVDAAQARARATEIVSRLSQRGGRGSAEELMPLVYDELRRRAAGLLRREGPGHTLQPTALVHEAYLKLVDQDRVGWQGRTHFFAIGALMMRRLLVDHARGVGRAKRAGDQVRVSLPEAIPATTGEIDAAGLLDLHNALERLARLDDRQARLVELRFFAGLTVEEAAAHLGIAHRTAEGDWTHAKAWLRRELSREES